MKNKLQKLLLRPKLITVALLFLSTLIPMPANAATTAQLNLSPSTKTVSNGDTVNLDLNLVAGGNSVLAWKANLTYSTSAFNSVTVATAAGSNFTLNPASDVSSGGVIRIARYATSASSTDQTVATISLHFVGSGNTSINFAHICSPTSDSSPCSAVTGSSGTNLLASTSGTSFAIPVAASSSGSTTTTKKKKSLASSIASAITNLIAPSSKATESTDVKTGNVVRISVFDQNSELVKGAKVTLGNKSAITNSSGEVILTGLRAGLAKGEIDFQHRKQSISLNVENGTSHNDPQIARFDIKVSSGSPLARVLLVVIGLAILAVIVFTIVGPRSSIKAKLSGLMHRNPPKPTSTPAFSTKSLTSVPTPPSIKHSILAATHHEPVAPGSVIRPSTDGFHH